PNIALWHCFEIGPFRCLNGNFLGLLVPKLRMAEVEVEVVNDS
ncbi:MAG: hypothetical protein ACI87V_000870, partial [Flavobacteriales bacterium]